MPEYKYLIIGGGMTADAAVRGIREADPQGAMGLIGDEPHPPYGRPPLSKGLWKGKPLVGIWRRTPPENLTLHLGRRAVALDPKAEVVADDQGTTYRYQRLLLATGGSARRLPFGAEQITYYRNLDDYHRLRALADKGQRFAIIGGGFIGSEMAAALKASGKDVRIIYPEIGIGARFSQRICRSSSMTTTVSGGGRGGGRATGGWVGDAGRQRSAEGPRRQVRAGMGDQG
jgi:3-phenylpropionate/trans-cinnamate dioxygenase ferredoxin reductase subunit